MDAMVAQLQALSKNPTQKGQNNSNEGAYEYASKDKEYNESIGKEEGAGSHQTRETMKDNLLEDRCPNHFGYSHT